MLLKPCARCGRAMPYGKSHCDACTAAVQAKQEETRRQSNRRYDRTRDPQVVAFYHTKAWKTLSAATLQRAGYLCEYCGRAIATEVDHVIPLDEDWSRRFDTDNLKATCHGCHDRKHGRFTPGGR